MQIKIYLRSYGPGLVTLRTDFKRESKDTPRISNLGLAIKTRIDEIIKDCEAAGKVVY